MYFAGFTTFKWLFRRPFSSSSAAEVDGFGMMISRHQRRYIVAFDIRYGLGSVLAPLQATIDLRVIDLQFLRFPDGLFEFNQGIFPSPRFLSRGPVIQLNMLNRYFHLPNRRLRRREHRWSHPSLIFSLELC